METIERWSRPSSGIRCTRVLRSINMVDHGNLHGVSLPWMEVIDEADGFH